MNLRVVQRLHSSASQPGPGPISPGQWVCGCLHTTYRAIAGVLIFLSPFCGRLTAGETDAAQSPASSSVPTNDLSELSLTQLLQVQYDTVYGASKHDQKLTDAPSAVTIVGVDEIKQYGYRTLGEVLQSVRGFYVSSDSDYNFVGVRGLNRPGDYGGRVLLNVDGHRLNDPIFDSFYSSTEFLLDLDLVDRVEIIRGPGSSLYGNNAFFAVVNVVTRRGRDIGGFETSAAAASHDTYTGRITYGNRFTNGVELLISGTYLESAGRDHLYFPEYQNINHGYADHADRTDSKSAFASLSYGDFTLEGGFIDRRKHIGTAEGYPYAVFNDTRYMDIDEREFGELKFAREFAGEWSVEARLYYDRYRSDGFYPDNNNAPAPGPTVMNRDLNQAQWLGTEVMISKVLWERQRLTLGGEFREDFQLDLANFDIDPPQSYLHSHQTISAIGIYAQDEISLLTNLVLNAGIRYDQFSSFGDTVNPRGALIYRPWDETTFKFIFGQAYRAPNAFELYYVTSGYIVKPGLKAETTRSWDLVYEQGLPGHLRLTTDLFVQEIEDLIGQALEPASGDVYFANIERVETRGVEAELEGQWAGGWRTRISYTFADARDTRSGNQLNNSPRHLGKANLIIPLWREKVFAGLELLTMSNRKTVQGNETDPVALVNATLFSRELIRHLEFSASLCNVLNQRYGDPVSADYKQDTIPQDGRSFRVKLTYHF